MVYLIIEAFDKIPSNVRDIYNKMNTQNLIKI